jgi:hypothetical protein
MSADEYTAMLGIDKRPPVKAVYGLPVRETKPAPKAKRKPKLTRSGPTAKRPVPKPILPSEKRVQAQIVKALRLAGYTVMETSQRRASGVSVGMPDLWVGRNDRHLWLGLEVKRDGEAWVSREQKALADAGMIYLVWTPQMALDRCRAWF